MTPRWSELLVATGVLLVTSAHVGSPDTFYEGDAGPYRLRVIVRPPGIVPGRADAPSPIIADATSSALHFAGKPPDPPLFRNYAT